MNELEMKILMLLSGRHAFPTDVLLTMALEKAEGHNEAQKALNALIEKRFVWIDPTDQQERWSITEAGLKAFNEQASREA